MGDMSGSDELILLGDFNFTHLVWSIDENLSTSTINQIFVEATAIDNVFSTGLFQVCSVRNLNERQLDLAFSTNNHSILVDEMDALVAVEQSHPGMAVVLVVLPNESPRVDDEKYNALYFSSANYAFFDKVTGGGLVVYICAI